jgi:SAM-dependent methyltransferase
VWSEAFGIRGVGVDRVKDFIKTGQARLTGDRVKLIHGDVLKYKDREKYDVVVCTELSVGLFGNFAEGIAFLEKFVKPGGVLVFGRLYSKIPEPPQELIDFDGPLPTLTGIYEEARRCGCLITAMASDTDAAWEQYIFRGAEKSLAALRKDPQDAWTDKWLRMYFDYRRPFEGWALFAAERI